MANATGSRAAGKVKKPHKDFPLFPHASGRWAKKVKGAFVYFGRVSDDTRGDRALALWLEQKDQLLAGRKPAKSGELTVERLGFQFLDDKELLRQAGDIQPRTFAEYRATCERVAEAFGRSTPVEQLQAEDFSRLRALLAKTRGPVALWNEIVRVRMIFKWAVESGKLAKLPVYGPAFKKPKSKQFDKADSARGEKGFTPAELRRVIEATKGKPLLHAVVMLAANCGYGQTDIAAIPISAVDVVNGWATCPRPKTGTKRRAKLWPETVAALNAYREVRPEPADPADAPLLFLNSRARRLVRASGGDDPKNWQWRTDGLGQVFNRLLKSLGLSGQRGFYGLRHSFQTGAEESGDLPAVMHCMGHKDASMSGRYRMVINDKRLEGVADAVHDWLFPAPAAEGGDA